MDPQQRTVVTQRSPTPQPGGEIYYFIIALFAVDLAFVIVVVSATHTVHQVPEGHVGAYWRGGALLKTITEPGFHLKLPFITNYEPVQVTLQTDQVKDIPCGTKGGVMITFEKIEVVNRLRKEHVYETLLKYGVKYDNTWIYDKIHHEMNRFCNSHSLQQVYIDIFDQVGEMMKDALQVDCTRYAPGIEILDVHVTKPKIPESVRLNFEQLEEERTKGLIAIEKQRVANVSKILMEQKLMEKESARKEHEIEYLLCLVAMLLVFVMAVVTLLVFSAFLASFVLCYSSLDRQIDG